MSGCNCPTQQVVDPPIKVFEDVFHPQIVRVIHPIEVIRRHHCVPIPEHIFTCVTRDEFCHTLSHEPKPIVSNAKSRISNAKSRVTKTKRRK